MRTKTLNADPTLSIHLLELVRFRVAHINFCQYCMAKHSIELKYLGDTEIRLSSISNWKEAPCFSDKEKALLALTDHLVKQNSDHLPDHIYPLLVPHFCLDMIYRLSLAIKQIGNWTLVMDNYNYQKKDLL